MTTIMEHKSPMVRKMECYRLLKKRSGSLYVANDKGELLHRNEDKVDEIQKYFGKVFGSKVTATIIRRFQKLHRRITPLEVWIAIGRLKNGRTVQIRTKHER